MIIELKNVPLYGTGLEIEKTNFTTLDTFETVDVKIGFSNDRDSDEKYWMVRIEMKNGTVTYRAPSPEKQELFYNVIKSAVTSNQDFLSIDFNDWK
jgi:hypothetical protein